MGINEFFYELSRVINQFAEELAEQRLLEREQKTGRGPKVELEKTEKKGGKEKEIHPDFPKTG